MLVRDFLERSAERLPDKIALVCGGQRFSYGDLDAQADRLAQALLANGVRRGDRVVVHLGNSAAAVVSVYAVLKAGAVFVPVNASTKPDKLQFILENCRATALISELRGQPLPLTEWLKMTIICNSDACARTNAVTFLGFNRIQEEFFAARPPRANEETDLACLIYTSGSTGQPKGVMCEHRQVVFASGSIIEYLGNTESDVVLNVLPLSFDYGLYQLLMTFRFGGTLVLENSFAFPSLVLERIEEERVTGFPGVPTIFTLLLGQDLAAYDLSSLRYLTNTAAALPPQHLLELHTKFPRAKVFSMYGLTETKRTLYLPPEQLERRPGSVGVPIPGTEAWIEDADGVRVGPGNIGELVVSGPHVMSGYWEQPEMTAARYQGRADGSRVCRTGDLFRQDQEGFFYFVARKDDIIKTRGEKVAPKEVENVLYALAGIREAAVVGVPDAILGEAVKAFVSCEHPLTETQIRAHCRAHLEDFMVPKEIEFCDALPKNNSGKIDKRALVNPGQPTPTNDLQKCAASPAF